MSNLFDKIISVFLNKKQLILKDSDINHTLITQGIQCDIKEIHRHVQFLSPALFQTSSHKDNSMIIEVDPKIDICDTFLAGHSHDQATSCGKLHLCREFGHCKIRNCHYPHDFNRGENRRIIEKMNYQHINCQLLVQLIRLKKSLTTYSQETSYRERSSLSNYHQRQTYEEDINKQIDISYPIINPRKPIDMEIIEMMLSKYEFNIEKIINECENDFFRRVTIQLEQIQDVDRLLNSSKFSKENDDIKLKRTKQLIHQSSFLLKIPYNNSQDRIIEGRLRLYVSLLVGNTTPFTIANLSTNDEEIFLIQCSFDLDLKKIHEQHRSRPQLQNKNVSLIQIYECDAISIQYIDENKSMISNDIENFISSGKKNVFTYEITNTNSVEIEFINTQAYREWMSMVEKIETKFQVTVSPVINDVDEQETRPSSSSSSFPIHNTASSFPTHNTASSFLTHNTASSFPTGNTASSFTTQNTPLNPMSSTVIDKSQFTIIKLRREWAMVAAHPVFQQEYKDYIHEQLGGEIEINGDEVTYTGDFPRLIHCSNNESVLTNKTNNYMQKLKYQTLNNLKPYHVNILRKHSLTIAFTRANKNDYLIAGKHQDIIALKTQLFPKSNQRNQTDSNSDNRRPIPNPLLQRETSTSSISTSLMSAPPSIYTVTSAEDLSIFSIDKFEERLQVHLEETFNVKVLIERTVINSKSKEEKSRIIIKISGQTNNVEHAIDDLTNLFSSLRTRKFDDQTDGNWTKMEDAIEIMQHHFSLNDLTCSCQKISSAIVHINHFDVTNPQFGVDEQKIEDLIINLFSLTTITYIPQPNSTKFMKEWTDLEDKIRKRDDYKKDICLNKETNTINLFGLTKLVKEFRQLFEELKTRYIPQTCKINLSEKQLNYLQHVAKNDLAKLEKQYKAEGCEINFNRLQQQGDFQAPPEMHSKIKANIEALLQIVEDTFDIDNHAFHVLINDEPEYLNSLIKSKCCLEKRIKTRQIFIPIPTSQVDDLKNLPQPQIPTKTNSSSINIGQSTISVVIGDLTEQTVDMIVVCSTSEVLRKAIIAKAGPQVQAEFDANYGNNQTLFRTSNGHLPCKRIYFIPWKSQPSDKSALQPSISKFVSSAISYAIKRNYTTIAFPSIGCGKLGFDPSTIAKHMLDETHIQLQSLNSKMDVSFVLVQDQQNVYDEFVKYLNTIQTSVSTTPKTPPKPKTTNPLNIPYDVKIIEITLMSSNNNHLIKCKNDIIELAQSSLFKKELKDKNYMIDWSQKTITDYYKFCLQHHVIPKLDPNTYTLELIGPRDAVHEADKYFYELTTETFNQARIAAVSRGVKWSVETVANSNNWEQYSDELNGTIEDAYSRKLAQVDFINDKREKCRIVFKSMEEQHGTDTRRIRRKLINSSLPDEWDLQSQNCIRVTLSTSSKEYLDVLQRFNLTMQGHHTQIVKIERIQNERWYKQYAAHRDEYIRRDGKSSEQLLFHGCPSTSADKITQECFNRALAGVNGVAFGCGVYFHINAFYSHSYTKPEVSGDRTMFLARVLVGKTCLGNPSMKVPPSGYDTTSDGKGISVIYHDAGAYAGHLITYK